MKIKKIYKADVEKFFNFLKKLDYETDFMMYEPDERTWNETQLIKQLENGNNLFLGVFHDQDIIGFLSAERGCYKRTKHSAYIVIGILGNFQNQGIGAKLFEELKIWTKENDIKRLELTVETSNVNAIKLYMKNGFVIEGVKKNTMLVNNKLRDEYMMARLY